MLHSAVGVIKEVKEKKNGRSIYTVNFKDSYGKVRTIKSWGVKDAKYNEGDSISVRYHGLDLFGSELIMADKIDDVDQNNDKIAISGMSVAVVGITALIIALIVRHVHKSVTEEE